MSSLRARSVCRCLGFVLSTALFAVAGCAGSPELDEEGEGLESVQQALTSKIAGPHGRTDGTAQGPVSNLTTPVTKFSVWADRNYIRGIKLHWGATSKMYGVQQGEKSTVLLGNNQYINQIYVDVDAQGWLRGLSFESSIVGGCLTVGYVGDGPFPVFTGSDARWTDLTAYVGNPASGETYLWGIKLNYQSN